jgi:hypothetical protein
MVDFIRFRELSILVSERRNKEKPFFRCEHEEAGKVGRTSGVARDRRARGEGIMAHHIPGRENQRA